MGGPSIAPIMLWTLLIMAVAFTTLFFTLHLMAIRNEILRRRLRRLSILEASGAERDPLGAPVPAGSAYAARG